MKNFLTLTTIPLYLFSAILLLSGPTHAQPMQGGPSFMKKTIKVGDKKLLVEIADTDQKQGYGLMYRTNLAEGTGMLFVFSNEETRMFWMKNTFVPLSIGYFNAQKILIDLKDMKPVKSEMEAPETYPSSGPAQYALEVPQGWFKKNKIKTGMKLQIL